MESHKMKIFRSDREEEMKLYNDKNRYDYFFKYYDDHCNDDGFSSDIIEKNNFAYIL